VQPVRLSSGCTSCVRCLWSLGGAVCHNCRPRMGELYQKQIVTASQHQIRFSRLWTQCQRCQGSLHQVRNHGYPPCSNLITRPYHFRMCCAVVKTVRYSTCGRRHRKMLRMRMRYWSVSMATYGSPFMAFFSLAYSILCLVPHHHRHLRTVAHLHVFDILEATPWRDV